MVRRAFLAAILACPAPLSASAPVPLPRAYSHNDYKQARPLFDALDGGFCAVEADIHLIDGELRVGHKKGETKPGVTLQKLYLDPLRERVRRHGGAVYPAGPGFTLLIDVKSDGRETYTVLREALKGYSEMLTTFSADSVAAGAVTVVISGHRDEETLSREPLRYAGLDGRPGDLDSDEKNLFPLISADWRTHFDWRGGRMDGRERSRLDKMLAQAHARGRKVRFWALPDREESWKLMLDSGVDFINTDKVEGLMSFLLRQRRKLWDLLTSSPAVADSLERAQRMLDGLRLKYGPAPQP